MKILAILGMLVSVIIIGVAAAFYFSAITQPMPNVPAFQADVPGAPAGGGAMNAVDTARALVSADKIRQRGIEEQLNKIDGGQ
jgi:hypothetical protein